MAASMQKYFRAFRMSQRVLNILNVKVFPINIKALIESCGILICTELDYKEFRYKTNDKRPYIKIKDGRAYYDPNRNVYLIVYNENIRNRHRINFTLAHEFAHIVLGHLTDERTELDRGGLPDYAYNRFEGEANAFAGNFLAPPIIIQEKLNRNPFDPETIARAFDLSLQAVRNYRVEDYKSWLKTQLIEDEITLIERYRTDKPASHCKQCSSEFYNKDWMYCPICGNDRLFIGGINNYMKYTGIKTDEDGYAKECPRCENEEHFPGGDYCIICGTEIINRCSLAKDDGTYDRFAPTCNYEASLPGNARYCPYCGSETTYFRSGHLKAWDQSNDAVQAFPILDDENGEGFPF